MAANELASVEVLREQALSSTAGQLVAALCLPDEMGAVRFNGPQSSNATVLKKMTSETGINWGGATGSGLIPVTDAQIFKFRNILRDKVWCFHQGAVASLFSFELINQRGDNQFDAFLPDDNEQWLDIGGSNVTSAFNPYLNMFIPACYDDGAYGYWKDDDGVAANNNVTIAFNVAPGVGTITMAVYAWLGETWQRTGFTFVSAGVISTTVGAGLMTSVGGNYVAWTIRSTDPAVTSVTITHFYDGDMWVHDSIPNLVTLLPTIQGVRVNAGSVRWRNQSSTLNDSGKIVTANVSPGTPWQAIATGANRLGQIYGFKSDRARVGGYMYLRPDESEDFQFQYDVSLLARPGTTQFVAAYPLQERSSYFTMAMQINDPLGRDTAIITTTAFEFLTIVMTETPEYPVYSEEDWVIATRFLRRLSNQFGNPSHIGEILRDIAGAAPRLGNLLASVLGLIPHPYTQYGSMALRSEQGQQLFGDIAAFGKKKKNKR
jgi:hypothetical protein